MGSVEARLAAMMPPRRGIGVLTHGPGDCAGSGQGWCPQAGTSANVCCLAPTAACNTGANCCSGVCNTNGTCAGIPTGGSCGSYSDCNQTTTANCLNNKCCAGFAQGCSSNADCCADVFNPLACGTTGASAGKCCKPPSASCTSNADCCSGSCNTGKGSCN